jgi:transposase
MNTTLYTAKNLEMNGKLRRFLLSSVRQGRSYREIAEELSAAGLPVSKSTIANWLAGRH